MKGTLYQSLQNIPVKEEVNPSGSSAQAVHNSNMMDTVDKSELAEKSRYGPNGFSYFFVFLPKTLICFNMKQDSQPTDRSYRQLLYTLEFSYHLSQLSHLHSVPSFYPCFFFLPMIWVEEAHFSAFLLVSALREGRIVGRKSPAQVSGMRFAKKAP